MSNKYLEKIAESYYHQHDMEMEDNTNSKNLMRNVAIASAVGTGGALGIASLVKRPAILAGVGALGLAGLTGVTMYNLHNASKRYIDFHKNALNSPLEKDRDRARKALQNFKDRGYNID